MHRTRTPTKSTAPEGRGETAAGVLILAGITAAELLVFPAAASPFRAGRWAVVVALVAVGMMVRVWGARRGRLRLVWHPLVGVLAALPVVRAVSALWSPAPNVTLVSAATAAVWIGAAVTMAGLSDRWFGRCAAAVVAATALSALVGLGQRLGFSPLTVSPVSPGARFAVVGLAGNPADLGCAALVALVVLALVRRPGRWAGAAAAVALIAGLAATGTLAAAAGLGLAAVVWVILVAPWSGRVRTVVLTLTVVVAGMAAASRLPAKVRQLRAGDWYGVLSARADGWTAALEMIRERPFTGVGAGAFGCRFAPARLAWLERHGGTGHRGERATHFEWAHCEPLELVAELGLLGVAWMAALVWAATRRPRPGPEAAVAAAGLAPVFLFHYPTRVAAVMAPVAVLVAVLVRLLPARPVRPRSWAVAGTVALAVVSVGSCGLVLRWQRWLGAAERALEAAQNMPPEARKRAAAAAELGAEPWTRRPYPDPAAAWRVVGRARLLRGAAGPAAAAFRRSLERCPHEEAWLGLGLALVASGRIAQGMPYLVDTCRLNPKLTEELPDASLREAVRAALPRSPRRR